MWKKAPKLFFEGNLAMPVAISSTDFSAKQCENAFCSGIGSSELPSPASLTCNIFRFALEAAEVSVLRQVVCGEYKQEPIAIQLSNARLGA